MMGIGSVAGAWFRPAWQLLLAWGVVCPEIAFAPPIGYHGKQRFPNRHGPDFYFKWEDLTVLVSFCLF
jgi:hypothetical protein